MWSGILYRCHWYKVNCLYTRLRLSEVLWTVFIAMLYTIDVPIIWRNGFSPDEKTVTKTKCIKINKKNRRKTCTHNEKRKIQRISWKLIAADTHANNTLFVLSSNNLIVFSSYGITWEFRIQVFACLINWLAFFFKTGIHWSRRCRGIGGKTIERWICHCEMDKEECSNEENQVPQP